MSFEMYNEFQEQNELDDTNKSFNEDDDQLDGSAESDYVSSPQVTAESDKKERMVYDESSLEEDIKNQKEAEGKDFLGKDPEDILNLAALEKEQDKAISEKQKKSKLKLAFKSLSKEDRKKIKDRIKLVKKLNKPHLDEPKELPLDNPENIIELKDVRKYYSNGFIITEILKGINLEIKHGELVIILGPSGSGKTTLMNIISGLDRASKGTVNVNGENLIAYKDGQLTQFRKRSIGYVFQQYGLLPNLTVKENIEIGRYLQKDESKKRNIDEILASLGLQEHANKFPHQLSGGQQQRVSIARAFAKNPLILFGDEPTGAVDEEMSKIILKEFVAINKEYKTTIIIVTHNPIFADLGNLVIKIKDGNIHELIRNENPKTVDELPWGSD